MVKSAPTSIDVCFEPIIVDLQGIKLNAITWGAVIRDSEVSIRSDLDRRVLLGHTKN